MTTIIAGQSSKITLQVLNNGSPVAISGNVQVQVFNQNGSKRLIEPRDVFEDTAGADWPAGVVAVEFDGTDTEALDIGSVMVALTGDFGIKRFKATVETLTDPTRTSLFIKDIVVQELREDRLMAAAAGAFQNIQVSDDYLWQKIRAAESEIGHTLRVPLVPTRFFPNEPTQEQIDALDGTAWAIDPAYDYQPDMFHFDKWGYFIARHKPIISVERMWFSYPSRTDGWFNVPQEWIRTDSRYGHIRLVPSTPALFTTMSTFIMTALAGSRTIPFMINLEYTAGLVDVETNYPELLDCIKKMAVLKVIADAFLPQSGSISADGLSQSISIDMSKYHESVDRTLNGEKGSNGGLMTKIHGIRMMVI